MTTLVDPTRIRSLNDEPLRRGRYVLYWMQQSQRAEYNHALEYAVKQANAAKLPILVVFGLLDDYPEANLRHYRFMLEGLAETRARLRKRGILLVIRHGRPDEVALRLSGDAALVVCDRGYLRHQRQWRRRVAKAAGRAVHEVESDVVVPIEVASDKAEYAARTLRPKLERQLDRYLVDFEPTALDEDSLGLRVEGLELDDLDSALSTLTIDRSVPPVSFRFRGGTLEAKRRYGAFLQNALPGYAENRSRPERDHVSHMSMYLHFGQISPLYLALRAEEANRSSREDRDAFLEELIVRRELAHNFAAFTPHYDQYRALPGWARETLERHRRDRRAYRYSAAELERAETHDPYWNAAMREMRYTGYLHNAMRMYWGKKILEWSGTPQHAYRTALRLNNKYFLDGRDPNSFANIGWLFGLHDRPWARRAIFGTVRYMAASGLERKLDVDAYLDRVNHLIAEARAHGVRYPED